MPPYPINAEVDVQLWRTQKSQHFVVHYQEASYGYVDRLISQAEKYYNSILDNLGFRRFDFWSWDNRAKIFLFKDDQDYQAEVKRFGWSGAVVEVRGRTIKTFIGQEGFFDSMLPHEMAHIIFREFIGENKLLPLWIDEGVACSQEQSTLAWRLKTAKEIINSGSWVSLAKLSDLRSSSEISPQIFYSQAASLISFLLNNYGRENFLDFSRRLRDGKDWQESLLSVYKFSSLEDMEIRWKEFMLK